MSKNIFVLGLDDFNQAAMLSGCDPDRSIHGLLDLKEILEGPHFDVPALLEKAESHLNQFDGQIDGLASYWDFPAILMLPILRQAFNLPGPSLEAVLKCEHKYWSRLEQKKVIAEHIPEFCIIDPFQDTKATIPLKMPFWIKPVKAHSSMLGFRIDNETQLNTALNKIRGEISQFEVPFNDIMAYADLPEEIKAIRGSYCIAEEIISAPHQCTMEGYVYDHEVVVYGVIDSIRKPNHSSFEAYEYPSQIPADIQGKMLAIATKAILQTGLNDSPFNIEFFYDPDTQRISLLEINARISKSHSLLFEKIDGQAHFKIMFDLAIGKKPSFPHRQGIFPCAAKFMPRLYGNHSQTVITQVPDNARLSMIEKQFPGARIHLEVKRGMQLSELIQQDSYSYQLATIFMGANDHCSLMDQYANCLEALDIKWRCENGWPIQNGEKIPV